MDIQLWKDAVAFHRHECPGLAIGFKACEAARQKVGLDFAVDEEWVCVTENDACGVDAVQFLTGCTLGKGNLIYRGTGKMAFSFFNRINGDSVRLVLKPLPKLERTEKIAYLLQAPVEEVFEFKEPSFNVPETASRFATIICEQCGEGAPEHKVRLQDGKKVCLDCFKEYNRGF